MTWPGSPIPSITPSTTTVPTVSSSTAANATSAHSGSGPIICPRFLIEVTSSDGRSLIVTVKSVPFVVVTRTFSTPSSAAIASHARCCARCSASTVSPHSPIPGSTEAIFALFAQDSLTAETWAKRFAHSRLVMMMISSELTIA